MGLRLIELTLPEWEEGALARAMEELHVIDMWHLRGQEGRVAAKLLVHSEDVEATLDRLEESFGKAEAFRVVVLEAEATVPRPQPDDQTHEQATGEEPKRAGRSRISVEELRADVVDMVKMTPVALVLTGIAAIVAAIGLMRDSAAIVIGSMVIAPLLGPNVGLALSATLADTKLGREAVTSAAARLLLVAVFAFAIGFAIPFDATSSAQLAARGKVTLSDVALGLAVGGAGVLSVTTGLSAALVGVMVAVALLPPLVAIGLFAGAGQYEAALNAAILVGTYLICINLAGVVTFALQGVRPRVYWEAERARRATWIAAVSWTVLLAALAAIIVFT